MRALPRLLIVAGFCAATAACMSSADPHWGSLERADAPMGPTFGQAVASMDNQIIDPTPALGLPSTSAARAASAIRRYERGEVIQPSGCGSQCESGGGESAPPDEGGGEEPSGGSKP